MPADRRRGLERLPGSVRRFRRKDRGRHRRRTDRSPLQLRVRFQRGPLRARPARKAPQGRDFADNRHEPPDSVFRRRLLPRRRQGNRSGAFRSGTPAAGRAAFCRKRSGDRRSFGPLVIRHAAQESLPRRCRTMSPNGGFRVRNRCAGRVHAERHDGALVPFVLARLHRQEHVETEAVRRFRLKDFRLGFAPRFQPRGLAFPIGFPRLRRNRENARSQAGAPSSRMVGRRFRFRCFPVRP